METASSPVSWLAALLDGIGADRQGRKWQCPVHALTGEHSVSLATGIRTDGTGAWIHCHAGCSLDDILRALHLTRADLRQPPSVEPKRYVQAFRLARKFPPARLDRNGSREERGYRFEAEHPYGKPSTAWKIRYRHPGSGRKEISWESLNGRGERVEGLLGRPQTDLPLYFEHELGMANATGDPVVLVESESSVDALRKLGIYATTWCGGAGDPPLTQLRTVLNASNTVLVPDNDEAGLRCRDRIVAAGVTRRVYVGRQGEDARDILARVGPDRFQALIRQVTP